MANITDIVREYQNRLNGFIRKRVKRLEDAEDILQEVFFQLRILKGQVRSWESYWSTMAKLPKLSISGRWFGMNWQQVC